MQAVRTLKSEKVKLDAAASAAVSQAALLAGTEGEADANAAVTAANAAVAAKQVEIDAAETEEATKQAAVDEQRDLIGQLVMFRYAQG